MLPKILSEGSYRTVPRTSEEKCQRIAQLLAEPVHRDDDLRCSTGLLLLPVIHQMREREREWRLHTVVKAQQQASFTIPGTGNSMAKGGGITVDGSEVNDQEITRDGASTVYRIVCPGSWLLPPCSCHSFPLPSTSHQWSFFGAVRWKGDAGCSQ
jgi:hypothetical protein